MGFMGFLSRVTGSHNAIHPHIRMSLQVNEERGRERPFHMRVLSVGMRGFGGGSLNPRVCIRQCPNEMLADGMKSGNQAHKSGWL